MNALTRNRLFPWIGVTFAMLAGCGGHSQVALRERTAQAFFGHLSGAKPGIKSEASNGALIYAVGGCGGTCVLSYPKGELVGNLSADGAAICSDNRGNIFISKDSTVTEYAHGATTPTGTFNLPGGGGLRCGPGDE